MFAEMCVLVLVGRGDPWGDGVLWGSSNYNSYYRVTFLLCLPLVQRHPTRAMGLIVISLFTEPFCLANYPSAFHSVMFNPVEPRLLATANSKEGVGLWDIRKPQR